jgi:U3 small nucleolar RNA-associated protein 23
LIRIKEDYHTRVVNALKRKEFGDPSKEPPKKRRKKGPNPLSCLKKKPRQKTILKPSKGSQEQDVVDSQSAQDSVKSDQKKRKRRSKKKKKENVASQ